MSDRGLFMDWRIAWRNIWRNPRRTLVIMTAVVIGVWSMVFLGALMRGMIDGMVENGISTLTGHVQIHDKQYPQDPSIDHRIEEPAAVENALDRILPPGSHRAARIRVNAIANNARHSTGVTLVGIEPPREADVSFIKHAVAEGRYLEPDDPHAILIGRALAERFETGPGYKLILMSQDTRGEIASRAFRIRGVFRAEMESTEKNFVFIHRDAAAQMLGAGDAVSEIAVLLPEHGQATAVAGKLDAALDERFSVRSWLEALPLLKAYLDMQDAYILIWYLVVFIAMAFGIVNTTLMAVFERMREFGLLKALGMRPRRIVKGVLAEASMILLCGIIAGNALGLFSCWLLSFHGLDLSALAEGAEYAGMTRVIYPELRGVDIAVASGAVLLLGLLVSLYPALKAARFTPVEAMGKG